MSKVKVSLIIITALIVTTLFFGVAWIKSSLPQTSGTIAMKGLHGPVTIARDAHAVPHISAASDLDIYFATGFVHAQDRLWQMEMNRRIAHGRVAEILGKDAVTIDRYMRTLGLTGKATSALKALPDEAKEALQAYAEGVNAFIKRHKGALPAEFILTGVIPEPWQPVDTVIWQKLMWLDLSGNMRLELARAKMLTKLSPAQVQSIYPAYPGDPKEIPLPNISANIENPNNFAVTSVIGTEKEAGYGSNNWVVSGEHTKSGKPLLANDPHLGLTTPSIWYLMRQHNTTNNTNVVGVGFPGSPFVVLGRNDKIAWGFTNTSPDSQDLFIEKIVGDGSEYLTPTGPEKFTIRDETIKVKGGEDINLTVRETRHGPVISDINPDKNNFLNDEHVLSLQWTALRDEDAAVYSLLKVNSAQNFEEFKEAGTYYSGPEQNMIYADTEGNIGYYAPSLVPVRHPDNKINGRIPSPGWDALYDWQGFIAYDELPTRYNPEGGVIATANEKIIDNVYPHYITRHWALPYRGDRIRDQLSKSSQHDNASFSKLHMDIISDMARDVVPHLLLLLNEESEAKNILASWDGSMDVNTVAPLIFQNWFRHYQEMIMRDELGDLYNEYKSQRPVLIKSTLFWSSNDTADTSTKDYYEIPVLDKDISLSWCDNVTTVETRENCGLYANNAMTKTIEELTHTYGTDTSKWTWGKEHILQQTHRPMSQVPQVKDIFELSSPISGSRYTVSVSGVSNNKAQLNHSSFGPSYRGIFDMSDLNRSIFIQPTGQSGNPLSSHYGDLFPRWRDGQYFEIRTDSAIPKNVKSELLLVPKK